MRLVSLLQVRSSTLYVSVVRRVRLQRSVLFSGYATVIHLPVEGHLRCSWGTFFHVLKRAKNRKSDASLEEAVWGMGSPDSASECGVA